MQLTIVIPALNEESAIGGTIERCLAIRNQFPKEWAIQDMRVVVISDGSTDRTVEIAKTFSAVDVIVFYENRGYGAAIKAGWNQAGGDLLGFLDADGTCDPQYFIPMCQQIIEQGKDIVLGCRMNEHSKMPWLRRLGNSLFAILLGFLSQKKVRDTASGMRIIRRDVLPKLLPLPDGLHFTPAMSARALMDEDIQVSEINMAYHERIGQSKLRAIRDGIRFLNVIISTAAYIRVSRLTMPVMITLGLVATLLMINPLYFYATHLRLEEWMFYRYVFSGMLTTLVGVVLCFTIVSEHISALVHLRYHKFHVDTRGLWRYETLVKVTLAVLIMWVIGLLLNLQGIYDFLMTGHVWLHWSRVLLGSFYTIILAQFGATLCTLKIIRALHQRQPYLNEGSE